MPSYLHVSSFRANMLPRRESPAAASTTVADHRRASPGQTRRPMTAPRQRPVRLPGLRAPPTLSVPAPGSRAFLRFVPKRFCPALHLLVSPSAAPVAQWTVGGSTFVRRFWVSHQPADSFPHRGLHETAAVRFLQGTLLQTLEDNDRTAALSGGGDTVSTAGRSSGRSSSGPWRPVGATRAPCAARAPCCARPPRTAGGPPRAPTGRAATQSLAVRSPAERWDGTFNLVLQIARGAS